MSTTTTNFAFTKPAVASATDADAWGTELNADLDSLDTILKQRPASSAGDYDFNTRDAQNVRLVKYYEKFTALGNISGATNLDLSLTNHFTCTLTGNVTFSFTNVPVSPTSIMLPIVLWTKQDGTGSRTITWPGTVNWQNAITPTPTTTGLHTDKWLFTTIDNGSNWSGDVLGQNYASIL